MDREIEEMIRKAHRNSSRNYGDVKIKEFPCGCKFITTTSSPNYTMIKKLCKKHSEN